MYAPSVDPGITRQNMLILQPDSCVDSYQLHSHPKDWNVKQCQISIWMPHHSGLNCTMVLVSRHREKLDTCIMIHHAGAITVEGYCQVELKGTKMSADSQVAHVLANGARGRRRLTASAIVQQHFQFLGWKGEFRAKCASLLFVDSPMGRLLVKMAWALSTLLLRLFDLHVRISNPEVDLSNGPLTPAP
ncbi:hypothetical protein B0T09DRAFT_400771 [Sordaria sp. MPI-SDFR-AT-0083]|nr:hypothetical protein B0T09DRAFT_400771 [Sordaria sp. MPI-SDFR-AT-0083]